MSQEPTDIVLLVHGIRDYALWQQTVRAALEEAGLHVEATSYGRFSLIEFIVPIPFFRRRAISAIWNQIRVVRQNNPTARISVVAHSFGTFVIANIMLKEFDARFHKVIFCGSVVPRSFPFERIQNRFEPPILNEVGTRDIWPAIAESITFGYGSAGTFGFLRPLARDRWHNGARHGYFLRPEFAIDFWLPFLKLGTIVPGAIEPEPTTTWLRLVSIFKAKYFLAGAMLLLLFWQSESVISAMSGSPTVAPPENVALTTPSLKLEPVSVPSVLTVAQTASPMDGYVPLGNLRFSEGASVSLVLQARLATDDKSTVFVNKVTLKVRKLSAETPKLGHLNPELIPGQGTATPRTYKVALKSENEFSIHFIDSKGGVHRVKGANLLSVGSTPDGLTFSRQETPQEAFSIDLRASGVGVWGISFEVGYIENGDVRDYTTPEIRIEHR